MQINAYVYIDLVRLGRALAVQHFGRELGGLAEIDEVRRHGVPRAQRFEVGERALDDAELYAPEKRRRRLAVAALARIQIEQALDGLWNPPRRDLRGEPAEHGAVVVPAAADHHEVL